MKISSTLILRNLIVIALQIIPTLIIGVFLIKKKTPEEREIIRKRLEEENKKYKDVVEENDKKINKIISVVVVILMILVTLFFLIYPNLFAIISMWALWLLFRSKVKLKYIWITFAMIFLFLSLLPKETKIMITTKIMYPEYKIIKEKVYNSCTNSMSCLFTEKDRARVELKNSNNEKKEIYFEKNNTGVWTILREEDKINYDIVNGDFVCILQTNSFGLVSVNDFELPFKIKYKFVSTDPSEIETYTCKIAYEENKIIYPVERDKRYQLKKTFDGKQVDPEDLDNYQYTTVKIYKIKGDNAYIFDEKKKDWQQKLNLENFNDFLSFNYAEDDIRKISATEAEELIRQHEKDCEDYENFVREKTIQMEENPWFLQLEKIEEGKLKEQLLLLQERGFLTKNILNFSYTNTYGCYITNIGLSEDCKDIKRIDLMFSEDYSVSAIEGNIVIWGPEEIVYAENDEVEFKEEYEVIIVNKVIDIDFLNKLKDQ